MATADEYLEKTIARIVDERIEARVQREMEVGLSVPEAAAALGISRSSAWRAIRRDEIRTVRVGGRVLVAQSEVERLLAGKPSDGA